MSTNSSFRRRRTLCSAAVFFALSAGCGDSDPGLVGGVPTNPDALFSWLTARSYDGWAAEEARHPTAGPHGDEVRTFFNPRLDASLGSDQNEVHQVGSSAVKELYRDRKLFGWAVMVKTETARGADAWYFYEALDINDRDNDIEGQAKAVCADCHEAGRDYVLSAWP